MATLYLTRSGIQADAMCRTGRSALPVFACATGHRWDKIIVTFKIEDPIPYQEEETTFGRRLAADIRRRERLALTEQWPHALRDMRSKLTHEDA